MVSTPTHSKHHILDLIITRAEDTLVDSIQALPTVSDHMWVTCDMSILKPGLPQKVISFRKLKSIDLALFSQDIEQSSLSKVEEFSSAEEMIHAYDTVMA